MFRRTGSGRPGGGSGGETPGGAGTGSPFPDPPASTVTLARRTPPAPSARTADLDSLLTTGPVFPMRVHGYDRRAVDNYVTWAESELAVSRGETERLLARYGACAAELEMSRRLLAEAPKAGDASPVGDRVRDILRLAADEASSMVESAGEEAGQILAEARAEADERLRKAHQIKEVAAAAADRMRVLAHRDRAEAAALLEGARAQADDMLGGATAERDRLVAEVAEVAEVGDQLSALRAELEDLRRQRDDARSALHRLTEQIEAALALASAGPSERFLLIGNTVAEHPAQSSPPVTVAS
jgi:cell division septum initiation protein DivIVA